MSTNGVPITNNIIYNTYRSDIVISGRNNLVQNNLVTTIPWSGSAQPLAVAQSNINYDAAITVRNAISVIMEVWIAAAPGFRFLGGWALREKNLRGLSPQSLIFQAPDFKKFRVFDWIWGGLDRIWGGSAPSRPSLAPPLSMDWRRTFLG